MPKQTTPTAGRVDSVLTSSNLQNISEQILNSIRELRASQGERVLLVMDQLDLLLAAGGKGMDAMSVGEFLLGLREASDFCVNETKLC